MVSECKGDLISMLAGDEETGHSRLYSSEGYLEA